MNIFEHYGIDWAAGLLTVLGIYLLGSRKKAGFIVMMTGNIVYMVFGLIVNSSGVIVANFVFFIMNIRGFVSWKKK